MFFKVDTDDTARPLDWLKTFLYIKFGDSIESHFEYLQTCDILLAVWRSFPLG